MVLFGRLVKSLISHRDALLFLESSTLQGKSFSDLICLVELFSRFQLHLTLNDITKTIKEKPEMEKYFTNKPTRTLHLISEKNGDTQSSHPSKTQQYPKQNKQNNHLSNHHNRPVSQTASRGNSSAVRKFNAINHESNRI